MFAATVKYPALAKALVPALFAAALAATWTSPTHASSHREAPFIASLPQVDATDFYMFRSYEAGREAYVTMVANYLPLQDPYGGPNYFKLDPNALYEIHIVNDGGAVENVTFQFKVQNTLDDNQLTVGGKKVSIPLTQNGSADVATPNSPALNVHETYTLGVIYGPRRASAPQPVLNTTKGGITTFDKPVDYIGDKTISNYIAYANKHIWDIQIPGCSGIGRVFSLEGMARTAELAQERISSFLHQRLELGLVVYKVKEGRGGEELLSHEQHGRLRQQQQVGGQHARGRRAGKLVQAFASQVVRQLIVVLEKKHHRRCRCLP